MKRWAQGIAWLAVALELIVALMFIAARPQWSKKVLRRQYVWMWDAANRLTGHDFSPPDRFR